MAALIAIIVIVILALVWLSESIRRVDSRITNEVSKTTMGHDRLMDSERAVGHLTDCVERCQSSLSCKTSHQVLGSWSTPLTLTPPTPIAVPETTLLFGSQPAESSVLPLPYATTLTGLSIELSSALTAGSLTVTLVVDNVLTTSALTITPANQDLITVSDWATVVDPQSSIGFVVTGTGVVASPTTTDLIVSVQPWAASRPTSR